MSESRVGENSNSSNNSNSFNSNCFNNTNSFNHTSNVINIGSADERAEILAWISSFEPWIRHHDIRAQRVEEVGNWLLQTEEYRNWFDSSPGGESDNSVLFCYGDPGVGKTYISSLVIDTLCDWAMGRDTVVVCFYFDFAAQKEQTPTAVLSSILKQAVSGLKEIPAGIVQAFRDQKKATGGRKLGLGQIVEMLRDLSSSRRTFICIDALDECIAEYRAGLLESLGQILQKSPSTRVFLAGRLHIRGEVEKHLARRVAAISTTPTMNDIIRFLGAKLKEDTIEDAMDDGLKEDIMKTIPGMASGIFLLISLHIKAILQETTLHRRREKLSAMTNGLGLGDTYDTAIRRIKAQGGGGAKLGMATLMWISHSERPLKVDEICHALSIEIGSTDVNTNNVPSIRTVLGCCQGLATVDKGSSTIRLIHFTLKEHLSGHADLFDRPHSKIAEICLTYLNFQSIKDLSANPACDPQGIPFLGYPSLHWGAHMLRELSDRSRYLALDLLDEYDNHISARLLSESIGWYFYSRKPFSALHCVSYFGIARLAVDLISTRRWDVNQMDSAGLTPLMWAARYGREEVVKLLLEQRDTEPDIPDMDYGRTALSFAAQRGHENVVKLFFGPLFVHPGGIGRWWGMPQVMRLLSRRKYVDYNRPDNNGRTPLWWAVRNGHDGVVKLLLGREEVDPNRPDNGGQILLLWAAENGHDGVVEILLGRGDVNPNRSDNYGQTLLLWAAQNGHVGVVKLLLGRKDIRPDKPDNDGRTPLGWAAGNGREGVVKLLLGRGNVDPDRPGKNGQTPLSWAARNGRDEVVKLLLGQKDVCPDKPDNDGRTPLGWAAGNGCEGVVKLLLGRENVDPDRPGKNGQTPLWWAAKNRREGVVKLLLEREDVDPNRPGNDGQTLLLWAAENGRGGVVKLLLGREDVDHGRPDNDGRTLLLWAAENGRDGVVKLLLEREGVDPSRPDNDGRTPLWWAAKNGRDGVVNILLGREDVDYNRPDNNGRTPLWWAAKGGHEVVVKLLLGRSGVDLDRSDNYVQMLLLWGALNARDGAVKLPLGWEDVDHDRPDNNGQTLLLWAARNGRDGVVKILLGREDVDCNRPDNNGRTPLWWAAWCGHEAVVELLLGREDVDPDRPDRDGRTALWWAAKSGREEVVKLLLGRENADPDRPDNDGRTPLWWAAKNGREGVVKLLKAQMSGTSGMA